MKTRIFGIGACLALAASIVAQTKPSIREAQAWTYEDSKLVSIRKEVDSSHRLHVDEVSEKVAKARLSEAWKVFQKERKPTNAYRFLYLCCHFRKSSLNFKNEIQTVFYAYPALPSYEWERVRSSIEAFQPTMSQQASRKIVNRLINREPEDTVNMESYLAITDQLTVLELDKALVMASELVARYPKVKNQYLQMEAGVLFAKADKTLSQSNYDKAIASYEKLRDEKAMPQKQADIAINSLKHAVEWLKSKGKLKP